MIKVTGLLLLDQIFENADIFGPGDFDSEHPIGVITNNKAVEREKLREVRSRECLGYF